MTGFARRSGVSLAFLVATVAACHSPYECYPPPPAPAVEHRATTPDSALVAAGSGALIVRVDSLRSASKWARPVFGRLRGNGRTVSLRQLGTSEILTADGLRPSTYQVTIGSIGHYARTMRVAIRAGYIDTVSAPLEGQVVMFCDPIFPPGGIFGGALQYR
jgi:hypothetical protein